ncbi:MAG: hypothetical protein DWQ05_02655 [Calditrichaeota bacterium]|nr:MAG: hypothetical protein DWQ05_02655 [Calditrichota bacterium]
MKIKHQISRLQITCPEQFDVEKILLQSHKHRILFRAFEEHMLNCSRCFRIVRKIHKFYEILDKEMQKEASPEVVAFAEAVYADKEKTINN